MAKKTESDGARAAKPQFLLKKEVAQRLRTSVRNVERKVRAGELPPLLQLSPNRVVFVEHEIEAKISELLSRRTTPNIVKVDAISDDQREAQALAWIKCKISEMAGHEVDLNHVRIQYRPPLSEDEPESPQSALLRVLAQLAEKFSEYPAERATHLAKYLFPALCDLFNRAEGREAGDEDDPYDVLAMGQCAVDDDRWQAHENETRVVKANAALPPK